MALSVATKITNVRGMSEDTTAIRDEAGSGAAKAGTIAEVLAMLGISDGDGIGNFNAIITPDNLLEIYESDGVTLGAISVGDITSSGDIHTISGGVIRDQTYSGNNLDLRFANGVVQLSGNNSVRIKAGVGTESILDSNGDWVFGGSLQFASGGSISQPSTVIIHDSTGGHSFQVSSSAVLTMAGTYVAANQNITLDPSDLVGWRSSAPAHIAADTVLARVQAGTVGIFTDGTYATAGNLTAGGITASDEVTVVGDDLGFSVGNGYGFFRKNSGGLVTLHSNGALYIEGDTVRTFGDTGFKVLNAAGTADAPLTAGGITASGVVTTIGDDTPNLLDITQTLTSNAVVLESQYVAGNYLPGLVWSTSDNNPTKPKAGIWVQTNSSGSSMYFGTSDNYLTGIDNVALVIDRTGSVTFGVNAAVTGDLTVGTTVFKMVQTSKLEIAPLTGVMRLYKAGVNSTLSLNDSLGSSALEIKSGGTEASISTEGLVTTLKIQPDVGDFVNIGNTVGTRKFNVYGDSYFDDDVTVSGDLDVTNSAGSTLANFHHVTNPSINIHDTTSGGAILKLGAFGSSASIYSTNVNTSLGLGSSGVQNVIVISSSQAIALNNDTTISGFLDVTNATGGLLADFHHATNPKIRIRNGSCNLDIAAIGGKGVIAPLNSGTSLTLGAAGVTDVVVLDPNATNDVTVNGSIAVTGILTTGAAVHRVVTTITAASTSLGTAHHHVYADTTSNTVTLDLPDIATCLGREYKIKLKAGGNSVIIDGFGTQTVEGLLTQVLSVIGEALTIVNDGTEWSIM